MKKETYIFENEIVFRNITEDMEKNQRLVETVIDLIGVIFPQWIYVAEVETSKEKLSDFLGCLKVKCKDNLYFILSQKQFKNFKKMRLATAINKLEEIFLPSPVQGYLASAIEMPSRRIHRLEEDWKLYGMKESEQELKGIAASSPSRHKLDLRSRDNLRAQALFDLSKSGEVELSKIGREYVEKHLLTKESETRDLSTWNKRGDSHESIEMAKDTKLKDLTPGSWDTAKLRIKDSRRIQ